MTGGPVDMTPIKSLPNLGALLWCGYPGQAGGQVIPTKAMRGCACADLPLL